MKHKLVIIISCLCNSAISQISFQEHILTDTSLDPQNPKSIFLADFDGDGDDDILSIETDKLSWYKNTNGLGNFGSRQIIDSGLDSGRSNFAADLDNDGDIDAIIISYNDDKIAWYENINGLGNFGPQQIISLDVNAPTSIFSSDIDGDGDEDLVSASGYDDKIAWYENIDGLGNFGPQQIISTNADFAVEVYVADMDNDNDMDVISASIGDSKVVWYENLDGLGSFGPEKFIANLVDNSVNIQIGDIDNDGDNDFLFSAPLNNRLVWLENTDGLGNFSTQHIISNSITGRLQLTDLDNDNDLDIVLGQPGSSQNRILWFENLDGLGNFQSEAIVNPEISASQFFIRDINDDGHKDIIAFSRIDDTIIWLKNTTNNNEFELQPVIAGGTKWVESVEAKDLDNDGDLDIISASSSDDRVVWFENLDGFGTMESYRIITTNAHQVHLALVCDIDGDQNTDIIFKHSTIGNYLSWYKNTNGLINFGELHHIPDDGFSSSGNFCPVDLDSDGDLDIVSAGGSTYTRWYENVNDIGTQWVEHFLYLNQYTRSIYLEDVDNDGDLDLISGNFSDITWYENIDSLGNFGSEQVITTEVYIVTSVIASDIDNDGDIDIVSTSLFDDKVAWYENLDGIGAFSAQQIISDDFNGASFVSAEDLDNDGYKDIVSSASYGNKISWFKNLDGEGNFSAENIISTNTNSARYLTTADINSDGNIDVVCASSNKVSWFENSGLLSLNESDFEKLMVYPNPASHDITITSQSPITQINVYTLLGQQILSIANTNKIDITKYSSGLYILKVKTLNGNIETIKIIKN